MREFLFWIARMNHRKGYSVHSPFAFQLITEVIYETATYYGYLKLNRVRALVKKSPKEAQKRVTKTKTDQLLLRLVNHFKPHSILEVGTQLGLSTLYLQSGKWDAQITSLDSINALNQQASALISTQAPNVNYQVGELQPLLYQYLKQRESIDLLYLHPYNIAETAQLFDLCLEKATAQSLFIVQDIQSTAEMSNWWKRIIQLPQVGVTFNLYHVGLIFFDLQKCKQDYIVRF